jgi:hypothetical protein
MKSGGALKGLSSHFKYHYMQYVLAWRENLREEQEKYKREIETKLGDLMDELRALDPDWEAWYDDDANVPEGTCAQIIPYIERRIEELKTSPALAEKNKKGEKK